MLSFGINTSRVKKKLDKVVSNIESVMAAALAEAAEKTAEIARTETFYTPHGTNGLREATKAVKITDDRWLVRANKPYAIFVNDGTSAHTILPVKGQFLRWLDASGKPIFARKVNHPGTKPYPFMDNAAQHAPIILEETILRHLQQLLK